VSSNRSDLKEFRRKLAESRNDAWNKLSTEAKIADLDKRLGVGAGAERQRAKLQKILHTQRVAESKKKEKKAATPEPVQKQEKDRARDKKR